MNRDEAIRKFGISYNIEAVPLAEAKEVVKSRLLAGIHHIRIVERLGGDGAHATAEGAANAARVRIDEEIRKRLAEIEQWESSPRTKLKIAAAHVGLKRDAADYLDRARAIRETVPLLRALRENGVNSELKPLPENLNLPVVLEAGQKIYRVEAYYLERAMDIAKTPLTEHTIASVSVKESWSGKFHDKYDYLPEYHLDNGERFTYARDAAGNEPIETGIVNYRYFLTKEAAQDHLRSIAQRITNAMKPYL